MNVTVIVMMRCLNKRCSNGCIIYAGIIMSLYVLLLYPYTIINILFNIIIAKMKKNIYLVIVRIKS